MQVFKIRNEKGFFSSGGKHPNWTKNGKTWSNIGHIKNHLNLVRGNKYDNAIIVGYELEEHEVFSMPIKIMLDELNKSKEEKQNKLDEEYKKLREDRERKMLADLKLRYEKDI